MTPSKLRVGAVRNKRHTLDAHVSLRSPMPMIVFQFHWGSFVRVSLSNFPFFRGLETLAIFGLGWVSGGFVCDFKWSMVLWFLSLTIQFSFKSLVIGWLLIVVFFVVFVKSVVLRAFGHFVSGPAKELSSMPTI